MDLTWNIYETAAANLSITEMKSFVQKELKDIQTQSRAVALHIGKSKYFFLRPDLSLTLRFQRDFLCDSKHFNSNDLHFLGEYVHIFLKPNFASFYANHNKSRIIKHSFAYQVPVKSSRMKKDPFMSILFHLKLVW